MTRDQIKAALREAYEAGRRQGNDEATAWEWGTRPRESADEVFNDLFADWNDGPIKTLLEAV